MIEEIRRSPVEVGRFIPIIFITWFQKHPKRWLALGFLIHQQFPPLHCGKESVEEGAQSLPSFITPSERLPGTSTSTLLMRVDTAEDGGNKYDENVKEVPITRWLTF